MQNKLIDKVSKEQAIDLLNTYKEQNPSENTWDYFSPDGGHFFMFKEPSENILKRIVFGDLAAKATREEVMTAYHMEACIYYPKSLDGNVIAFFQILGEALLHFMDEKKMNGGRL